MLRCVLSLQVTLDSGEEYQAKVRKQGDLACEDTGCCGILRQLIPLQHLLPHNPQISFPKAAPPPAYPPVLNPLPHTSFVQWH